MIDEKTRQALKRRRDDLEEAHRCLYELAKAYDPADPDKLDEIYLAMRLVSQEIRIVTNDILADSAKDLQSWTDEIKGAKQKLDNAKKDAYRMREALKLTDRMLSGFASLVAALP